MTDLISRQAAIKGKISIQRANGCCNRLIDDLTYNYCPWCGQKILWEENDD